MGVSTQPQPGLANAGWSHSTPLLAGDAGTSQTIALIRTAVWQGLQDARVRAQLSQILQNVPAHDSLAEIRAIYAWVLRHIRFTNDPVGHETVATAHWTLTHRIGDCDDINGVLIPTLVMAAGIPVRLVTISNDPSDPSRFSHIYAEAEIRGQWVPLDAARPGASFGTTTAHHLRKRVWSLVDQAYQDLAGLSGVRAPLRSRAYGRQAGMGFDWDVFGNIIANISSTVSKVWPGSRLPISPAVQAPPVPSTNLQSVSSSTVPLLLGGLGIGALILMQMRK